MGAEHDVDLAELAALAAEHVRWEMDLGGRGLPDIREALASDSAKEAAPSSAAAPEAPVAERAPTVERTASVSTGATDERRARLTVLAEQVSTCTKCGLHRGRTHTVFARGNPDAVLAFVGEGPGYHEDQQGLPFVGPAGKLLDRMIAAMGFSQDEVYICNVVKCRPPENRTPNPDEAAACIPYLREQLELVRPEVIVALGRHAAENLGVAEPGHRWRGTWGRFSGIRVLCTYHPAYLLRNPEQKRPVWQDLQAVVAEMGRELPTARPG